MAQEQKVRSFFSRAVSEPTHFHESDGVVTWSQNTCDGYRSCPRYIRRSLLAVPRPPRSNECSVDIVQCTTLVIDSNSFRNYAEIRAGF